MMASAAALGVALSIAAADAPSRIRLVESELSPPGVSRLFTLEDAPTTPGQSFGASLATSTTGLVVLLGLIAGPIDEDLPLSDVSFYSRLATGLLLLSVGPSVGDLLNHDTSGFLVGAGGRTLLVALASGAVVLTVANQGRDPLLAATTVLFVTLGALVWAGWSAADLVRSIFAPERWVDRQNEPLRRRRSPQPRTF